jgi:thiol:disulfide interchange protein DsbD
MKKVLMLLCCFFMVMAADAQGRKARWNFSAKKIKPGFYELHFTAEVEPGWNIYSQFTPKGGPLPTAIIFSPNDNILLGGKAKEVGFKRIKHEEVFGVDVHYFVEKVDFVQVIKLKVVKPDVIKGKINFMTCDKHQCITDEVEFSIPIK